MNNGTTRTVTKTPTIIAIIGKTSSGKDTALNLILSSTSECKYNKIILDTTRPIRAEEVDGESYNFIPPAIFVNNIINKKYVSYKCYNNWHYGVPKLQFSDSTNIGVFSPEELVDVYERYKNMAEITVIYVKTSFIKRLIRYIKRDSKFSINMLKRFFSDYVSFNKLEKSELYRKLLQENKVVFV